MNFDELIIPVDKTEEEREKAIDQALIKEILCVLRKIALESKTNRCKIYRRSVSAGKERSLKSAKIACEKLKEKGYNATCCVHKSHTGFEENIEFNISWEDNK